MKSLHDRTRWEAHPTFFGPAATLLSIHDHEELTAAIAEVEASFVTGGDRERARRAVRSFDEILVAHLAREESLVVPVLLELSPERAWAMIHDASA